MPPGECVLQSVRSGYFQLPTRVLRLSRQLCLPLRQQIRLLWSRYISYEFHMLLGPSAIWHTTRGGMHSHRWRHCCMPTAEGKFMRATWRIQYQASQSLLTYGFFLSIIKLIRSRTERLPAKSICRYGGYCRLDSDCVLGKFDIFYAEIMFVQFTKYCVVI